MAAEPAATVPPWGDWARAGRARPEAARRVAAVRRRRVMAMVGSGCGIWFAAGGGVVRGGVPSRGGRAVDHTYRLGGVRGCADRRGSQEARGAPIRFPLERPPIGGTSWTTERELVDEAEEVADVEHGRRGGVVAVRPRVAGAEAVEEADEIQSIEHGGHGAVVAVGV